MVHPVGTHLAHTSQKKKKKHVSLLKLINAADIFWLLIFYFREFCSREGSLLEQIRSPDTTGG